MGLKKKDGLSMLKFPFLRKCLNVLKYNDCCFTESAIVIVVQYGRLWQHKTKLNPSICT